MTVIMLLGDSNRVISRDKIESFQFKVEVILFILFVLNATFSNISAISWRPVLVVEEAEYPERTTDHGQATDKLYHLRCESSAPFFVIYKAGREPTPYW